MVLLLLLFQLCLLFHADAAGSSSELQVLIPQNLTKPGGYDHRDALFGVVPSGGSIEQKVYYANSTLCRSNDIDPSQGYPKRSDGSGWETPFILMVDRGDCPFVTKVRNAQFSGAAAVLVADSMCLCDRPNCIRDDNGMCEQQEPIMADDGSGSDVTIPSVLIFKEDADEMKAVLKNNQYMQIQMSFKIPAPDDRVEYHLLYSPLDAISRPIQETWGPAAVALGQHSYFYPHLYIYDGKVAGCQGPDGNNQCYSLCTNNGLYCSTDPDDDLDEGVSGADVVVEALRRLCMWNLYGRDDGIGKEWWDYVAAFAKDCSDKWGDSVHSYYKFKDEQCIGASMESAGINRSMVDKCMADAGGFDSDSNNQNTVLDEEISVQAAFGPTVIPSLAVNGAFVRGSLSFSTMFQAICSGFTPDAKPQVCQDCADCPQEEDCVLNNSICPDTGTDSPSALPTVSPSAAPSMAPSSTPSLVPSLMPSVHLETSSADGRVHLRLFGGTLVALIVLFLSISGFRYQQRQRMMRNRGIAVQEAGKTSFGGTSLALEEDDGDDGEGCESGESDGIMT